MKNATKKGTFDYDEKCDELHVTIRGVFFDETIEQYGLTLTIDEKQNIMTIEIARAAEIFGVKKEVLREMTKINLKARTESGILTLEFQFAKKGKIVPGLYRITERLAKKIVDNTVEVVAHPSKPEEKLTADERLKIRKIVKGYEKTLKALGKA